MSKKRVHELAKELGIESKELLARLEKMGITVKSHSSTLEETDVARVQREFLSQEPHEVVEKRIKSTVIRRRNIRLPEEQPAPPPVSEAEHALPPETAKEAQPAAETGRMETVPQKAAAGRVTAPATPREGVLKKEAVPEGVVAPKKDETRRKKAAAPAAAPEVQAGKGQVSAEKKPVPAAPAAGGLKTAGARPEKVVRREERKAPEPALVETIPLTEEERAEKERRDAEKLKRRARPPLRS